MTTSVDDIVMIEHDPADIYQYMKNFHEAETGETLPEADMFDIAYRAVAAMFGAGLAACDDAAKQNFLRFARGLRLDLKGELYGERGARIGEEHASTVMRCYISRSQPKDVVIKKGTRFINGTYIFESQAEGIVIPGNMYTDIEVLSSLPGYIPEFQVGEINEIVDKWDFYESTENITEVAGGTSEQTDDEYRNTLDIILESFSTAGPALAYEFWALKASTDIKDAKATSPSPSTIDICLLGEDGVGVSDEVKDLVLESISQEKTSPLGDRISISDSSKVNFEIDLTYYYYQSDETRVQEMDAALRRDLDTYIEDMKGSLGGEINPQDIVGIAKIIGFKRIDLREPSTYQELTTSEVGFCSDINIAGSISGVQK